MREIFTPGTSTRDIVTFVTERATPGRPADPTSRALMRVLEVKAGLTMSRAGVAG